MSIKMNERYSGISHVFAEDEAAVKAALVGATGLLGSYEIDTEELTEASAAVPDGAFCWNGRCGLISGEDDATWSAPASGKYAKVWVCVHYVKVNSVETVSVEAVRSEDKASQAAADGTEFPYSTALSSETTEARLPLFSVTVSSTEVKSSEVIQPVIPSLSGLDGKCADIDDDVTDVSEALSDEVSARTAAVGGLSDRLTAIETTRQKDVSISLSTTAADISCIDGNINYYSTAALAIVQIYFSYNSKSYYQNIYLPLDDSGKKYETAFIGAGSLSTFSTAAVGSSGSKTDAGGIGNHEHGISHISAPCYCRVLVWGDSANSQLKAQLDGNYVTNLTAKIQNITFIGKVG